MNANKGMTGDVFGGLTAAIVALPLALAFGVQSGLGAVAGLYGAIVLGIVAALLGGTPTQISGPTGPMTVVAAAIVSAEAAYFGSLEAAMPAIVMTFVLAGLFQALMGLARLGQYIKYMPYPVISGFMSGIGVIIIALQIFPLLGQASPKTTVDILLALPAALGRVNGQSLGLALGVVATIYLFPKVTRAVPSTLVALLGFTMLSAALGLDVPTIGHIPQGLPSFHLSALLDMKWHDPGIIIFTALTLASLGAIDSLLTSVVSDNMTRTQHHSNKELIGQGIGNALAGLVGGIPGAGATIRTVVNIQSGGRSRLSGATHGLVLLIILFGASAYAGKIPLAVLAGILVTVGVGIIDYRSLRDIKHIPRADMAIMLSVMLLTVFVDLLQAVGIGMVMAALWFMKQMGDLAEENAKGHVLIHEDQAALPDERPLLEAMGGRVYIQHFDGPIFFGFTFGFNKIIRELPEVQMVVFRMENVPYMDQSGLYAFEDAVTELKSKGIDVVFCGLQPQPQGMFEKVKIIPNLVADDKIFTTFQQIAARGG
ncbi:sodium-independent anion transporter [Chromobacterium phragmitis]|uniref:SulP family inorganic anion transporter n=1 Tax=Chromobacterium phragmitis TaxID=2202141 RepID=UPI000DECF59B|nr:SulP family inorganic anion transporter [Chromobacterium phragmitis]AXE31750.1 sodium-independent anion transporter [Chromobacterium phragmitis]